MQPRYPGDMAGHGSQTSTIAKDNLVKAIEDFSPQIERLQRVLGELRMVCDAIEGVHPSEVAENSPESPPHSLLDNAHRKCRNLSTLIGLCEEATMRLRNVVGIP